MADPAPNGGGQPPPNPTPSDRVVLTPEQFQALQRGQLLLQKLAQGTTKRKFENLVKEIVPEVETTDDQIAEFAQPYVDKLEETNKRLEDFLSAQAKEKEDHAASEAAAKLSQAFADMRNEGLTEEGEGKIRELMIDRNIADPWAALALWERNNPKPPEGVASYEPDMWDLEGNAVGRDNKGLFDNPDRWMGQEIANVLAEMRRPQQV
jgi:hypothetical protein